METRYKAIAVNEKDLFVSVYCNYVNLSDAKSAYQEDKDDSIVIEMTNNENRIGAVCIGIDEAERIALALLNISNSIKY
ncbi:hypothetical protein SAMN04488072_1283 [Lentibacillus halodurans]|uniref:Uncharacterized protein n=1 Tax=Lentibacillus halodurans TaxID=237679 RepID=A0A1I1AQA9_9BACI|nr:hypothetical protein [Lentibacillus halodurans]SFB39672.1 hypothetical protein SAMN04488072_1283 [Lentibacillus halodurans]